jgi:hypothetical protein
MGATMDDSGADAQLRLQVSRDNFVGDIRNKMRLVMPVGGSHIKSPRKPIIVQPGESFRVIFRQAVAAPASSELFGTTDLDSIMD